MQLLIYSANYYQQPTLSGFKSQKSIFFSSLFETCPSQIRSRMAGNQKMTTFFTKKISMQILQYKNNSNSKIRIRIIF